MVLHRETIGARIAARRDELGLTQEELAERCGVRAQTVSRWERGANLGRLGNLGRVAEALEISVADLTVDLDDPAASEKPKPVPTEVAELSATVRELRAELVATRLELRAEIEKVRKAPASPRKTQRPAKPGRTAKGK